MYVLYKLHFQRLFHVATSLTFESQQLKHCVPSVCDQSDLVILWIVIKSRSCSLFLGKVFVAGTSARRAGEGAARLALPGLARALRDGEWQARTHDGTADGGERLIRNASLSSTRAL